MIYLPVMKTQPMDDRETLNRRARLRELISECFDGKLANLMDHIKDRTGKTPNQGELSALQRDHSAAKSFGDKKAKTLTEQVGLSRRWFDMPAGNQIRRDEWLVDVAPPSKVTALPKQQDPIISRIVKMLESTDDVGRGVALQAITTALENYRPTRKHRAN